MDVKEVAENKYEIKGVLPNGDVVQIKLDTRAVGREFIGAVTIITKDGGFNIKRCLIKNSVPIRIKEDLLWTEKE